MTSTLLIKNELSEFELSEYGKIFVNAGFQGFKYNNLYVSRLYND